MACIKCQGIADLPLRFFDPPLRFIRPDPGRVSQDESDEVELLAHEDGRYITDQIDDEPQTQELAYEHWESIALLWASAKNGCAGCTLIVAAFGHTGEEDEKEVHNTLSASNEPMPPLPAPIILKSTNKAFYATLTFYDTWSGDDDEKPIEMIRHLEVSCSSLRRQGELEFFVKREEWDVIPTWYSAVPGRETYHRSDSYGSFAMAKDWLKNCVENHAACSSQATGVSPLLPTRLIDVGPPDGSHEPRLVSTVDGQRGLYTALSHCWGHSPGPLTTRSDTLEERLAGIPLTDMPQTFQDAVMITRAFDIRYIWIDSLCIIQDDSEDWDFESAQMVKVYGNCYFSIAALLSRNSHEGIFKDRPTGPTLELVVQDSKSGEFGHLCMRQPAISTITSSFGFLKGPLEERAWVLQERLMAPRILKYGATQMFWECQEGTLLESQSDPNPTMLSKTSDRTTDMDMKAWKTRLRNARAATRIDMSVVRDQELRTDGEDDANQYDTQKEGAEIAVYDLWYNVINEYSRRKLTKETDKLPALAGLAEEFARITNDTYLAGFWKRDLLRALLWRMSSEFPHSAVGYGRAPEEYRAPSWTWASLDGPLATDGCAGSRRARNDELDAQILRVETTSRGSQQEFASNTCSQLKIAGFTLATKCTLTYDMKIIRAWSLDFEGVTKERYFVSGQLDLEPWTTNEGPSAQTFRTLETSAQCVLLLIGNWGGEDSERWAGLMLSEADYADEHRRLGTFTCTIMQHRIEEFHKDWERQELVIV